MQFWAICMVCLWGGIGLFNWLTGLHWLAEFSLPMSVVAGVALAIASHTTPSPTTTPQENESLNIVPASASDTTENQPLPQSPPTPSTQPKSISESSISFTIHKNIHPQ